MHAKILDIGLFADRLPGSMEVSEWLTRQPAGEDVALGWSMRLDLRKQLASRRIQGYAVQFFLLGVGAWLFPRTLSRRAADGGMTEGALVVRMSAYGGGAVEAAPWSELRFLAEVVEQVGADRFCATIVPSG